MTVMDLPLLKCSKIKISTVTHAVYLVLIAVLKMTSVHILVYVWVEHVAHIIKLWCAVTWVCLPGLSYTNN